MKISFPKIAALVLPVLALGACAGLLPMSYEIPLGQLQSALASRLPLESRYLGLFDVRLENPRLTLSGSRLGVALDTSIKPTLLPNTWRGNFALSGVPRLDMQKSAVMLGQIQVDRLSVDGMPPAFGDQLSKLGNALAQRFASDLPVYSFKPSDLQIAGARFQPTNIKTSGNGLVVSFEPTR